jgi:hypothetical protein
VKAVHTARGQDNASANINYKLNYSVRKSISEWLASHTSSFDMTVSVFLFCILHSSSNIKTIK